MASQPRLGPAYVPKSQLQSVWSSMDNQSVSIHAESPCASAATKRVASEAVSISGTTPIDSNGSDFSLKDTIAITIKEEESEDEQETAPTTNKVSPSKGGNVDAVANFDPSPSKIGKPKL